LSIFEVIDKQKVYQEWLKATDVGDLYDKHGDSISKVKTMVNDRLTELSGEKPALHGVRSALHYTLVEMQEDALYVALIPLNNDIRAKLDELSGGDENVRQWAHNVLFGFLGDISDTVSMEEIPMDGIDRKAWGLTYAKRVDLVLRGKAWMTKTHKLIN
jgi:hypothetical protein